jgi:mono/diheme cytochrome c family protein
MLLAAKYGRLLDGLSRVAGVHPGICLAVGAIVAGLGAPQARAQQPASQPAAEETPSPASLTEQYCLACHNDNLKTAGISLQRLNASDVSTDAYVWEKVLRKVSAGEMPPAGMPHPDQPAVAAFTSWLTDALDRAAEKNPDPGRPTLHRLNRAEYSNAIRDLLALDIDPGDTLPADDSGYGFDNIADVLSVSPVLLERYILVARRVSRLAVGNTAEKPFKETFKRSRATGFLDAGQPRNVTYDLPFGARGGTSLRYYFPLDAEYVITIELNGGGENPGETHQLRLPLKAGMRTLGITFLGDAAKEESAAPSLGRRFFGAPPKAETPAPLDVRLDGARVQLIDLPPSASAPRLTGVTIAGPYNAQGPGDTPSRARIFTCRPATSAEEGSCAKQILASLARRAYRRPVTDADVSPLMALYQMGRQESDFEVGIEKALQAMLVSPSFLFRLERDPAGLAPGSVYRLSDVELASRLSFFLWSSIPDEELLRLAEQGKLHDPDILEHQVRRMLDDRRAQALVENFAGQWLYLRNVESVKPDAEEFPDFDADLRVAMERETQLFFETILRENRSVLEFLDADYTFLNQRLAEHYGIPNIYGPQFRKVTLKDSNRGGLLGQASILAVTSYPNRTSVVLRGKWVLENLFGMPPPPPPPDVPDLKEKASSGKRLSMREAMEMHRVNPTCASCHARMDPIGFALENYDAVGKWRTVDAGSPIDATGKLPDGSEFEGPAELKKVLLSGYRDQFVKTVTEKLLTYALGRGVEYYDKPTVRSITRQAVRDHYRLQDLIVAIAASTPFQMRRMPES